MCKHMVRWKYKITHPAAGADVEDAGEGDWALTGLGVGTSDGVAAGVGCGDWSLTGLGDWLLTGRAELAVGGRVAVGVCATRGADGMEGPPDWTT